MRSPSPIMESKAQLDVDISKSPLVKGQNKDNSLEYTSTQRPLSTTGFMRKDAPTIGNPLMMKMNM